MSHILLSCMTTNIFGSDVKNRFVPRKRDENQNEKWEYAQDYVGWLRNTVDCLFSSIRIIMITFFLRLDSFFISSNVII